MPHDSIFAVCANPSIFVTSRYKPIDYRLVITRAIYCAIRDEAQSDDLQKKLTDARQFVSEINATGKSTFAKSLNYENFIELCAFRKGENIGVLLIDHTRGCFPLVAYPESDTSESTRVSALLKAINDICNSYVRIVECYKADYEDNWITIKEELTGKIYGYKDDNVTFK